MSRLRPAPGLKVSTWLNAPEPITLESLAGKVILIEAFQMLCPGCVEHGLPQASRVRATFSESEVAVLGLHSVFEHHEAQGSATWARISTISPSSKPAARSAATSLSPIWARRSTTASAKRSAAATFGSAERPA